jgi:hypothetical protein
MVNTTYSEPTYIPKLYGIIGNYLVTVDQNTGHATEVGIINATNVHGLAYDRFGDTLYSIANATDPELIIVNRTTAEATLVGPVDLAGYDPDFLKIAESIAFNPADGILYGSAGPTVPFSNLLIRIDPATGIATQIAPITGTTENDGDSMVFINGTLYLVDTSGYGSLLYTVNLSSGVATTIGPISDYYLHVTLAYNPETQRLFGTAPQDWLLIEISPSTGQATVIGPTHTPEDFEGAMLHTIGVAFDIEMLTASISPVSSSIVIGNSVTFTSTVSGGTTPYSYQWYLDDTPVSGETSASWTFTPTTLGNYIVQLNVTDSLANIAESNIANVIVNAAVHDVAIVTLLSPAGPITLGQTVTDKVTISTSATGTLPSASGTWTVYVADNSGMSDEVLVGTGSVSGALPFVVTSPPFAPMHAGTWYFQAFYSGDANYTASQSTPTDEQLVVGPASVPVQITFDQIGMSNDFGGTVLTVDGTVYTYAVLPVSFSWYSGSSHSFAFQSPLAVGANSKQYVWTGTTGLATLQSGSFIVSSSGNITGNYKTQYYLTVRTDPVGIAAISGGGWYDSTSSAVLTAPAVQDFILGYWDVDGASQGNGINPITTMMNASHVATAHYAYSNPLIVHIQPTSASINLGQSVTFSSIVQGGTSPYAYQWYLEGNPVSGATSNGWIFTPSSAGIHYVYLLVTDFSNNTAQSETARIVVTLVPVGGYSVAFDEHALAKPLATNFALIIGLALFLVAFKRRTRGFIPN